MFTSSSLIFSSFHFFLAASSDITLTEHNANNIFYTSNSIQSPLSFSIHDPWKHQITSLCRPTATGASATALWRLGTVRSAAAAADRGKHLCTRPARSSSCSTWPGSLPLCLAHTTPSHQVDLCLEWLLVTYNFFSLC